MEGKTLHIESVSSFYTRSVGRYTFIHCAPTEVQESLHFDQRMERFELHSGQAVGGAALLEPVSGEGVGFLSRGTTVLAHSFRS